MINSQVTESYTFMEEDARISEFVSSCSTYEAEIEDPEENSFLSFEVVYGGEEDQEEG